MTTKTKNSFSEIIKQAKKNKDEIIANKTQKDSFIKMGKKVQKDIIKTFYSAYSEIMNLAFNEKIEEEQFMCYIIELAQAFGDEFALLVKNPDAEAYEKVCKVVGVEIEYIDGIAQIKTVINSIGDKLPIATENKKDGFIVKGANAYPGAFEDVDAEEKEMLQLARMCYQDPEAYKTIPVVYFARGTFIEAVTDMIKKCLFKKVEDIHDVASMQAFEKDVERIGQIISDANENARAVIVEQERLNQEMILQLEEIAKYKQELMDICGKVGEKNVFKFTGDFENVQTIQLQDFVGEGITFVPQELKKTVYRSAVAILDSYSTHFKKYICNLYAKMLLTKDEALKNKKDIARILKTVKDLVGEADLYDKILAKTQAKISGIGKDMLTKEI